MKNRNIKNLLFHSIIFFSFDAVAAGTGCDIGLNSVKATVDALPKMEKVLSGFGQSLGLLEASKNAALAGATLGVEAVKIGAPAAIEVSKNGVVISANTLKAVEAGGTTLVDASSNLGVEAATQVAKSVHGFTVVAGVAVAIYGVTQLYPIGKEIYTTAFPSEEQEKAYAANLIAARKRLRYLQEEERFTNCIINFKAGSPRNHSGRPVECEDAATIFSELGGRHQVKEVTETFNEFHQ
jgi:hypothetical protein